MKKKPTTSRNIDAGTVRSFGSEWTRFDQSALSTEEAEALFRQYFSIFPWDAIGPDAIGFDMGCGSGRWAKFVASKVGLLTCIDPSRDALDIARRNLSEFQNVRFALADTDNVQIEPHSQDFGYSLGVLHHVPDTAKALKRCVDLLKPGAPFLVYLYYRFDNRPLWFRSIWKASDALRAVISRMPERLKLVSTDLLAFVAYLPLARTSALLEKLGVDCRNVPLYAYRNVSVYTMRTDSRDRFGTPLEQRFTREEIQQLMEEAGLEDVCFSEAPPYWCAVGRKKPT